MGRFGARLVRAMVYGMLLATILALLFSAGGAILATLSGGALPLKATQLALLGGVIGLTAPIAMELSAKYEEDSGKK